MFVRWELALMMAIEGEVYMFFLGCCLGMLRPHRCLSYLARRCVPYWPFNDKILDVHQFLVEDYTEECV